MIPTPQKPATTTLEGILERVTYANEENGWSVIKLAVTGRAELVTAVGNLIGISPGENLRLRGRWSLDRKYGEQFRVESFATIRPATLVGIERYLGSGLVEGIGKVMAQRLVRHFGLQTLEVIDDHPERLAEVEGIGPVRSARIEQAWAEQRRVKDVMVFLQSHGVSTTYAIKIYKQYGDRAIEVVKGNPYRLAADIFGIGFLTADRIASHLGISKSSPERAEAGLLHVLGQLSSEGHVFYPKAGLVEATAKLLEIDPAPLEQALPRLAEAQAIVTAPAEDGEAIYLRSLFIAETGIARSLRALLATPQSPLSIDVERALVWLEQRQSLTLAPEQREAIAAALRKKVLIVTGGPGTGKTTLVNGVIQILERKGRRILLGAPTGRAAKRMTEATGHPAKTLHRLLELNPQRRGFDRNEQHPLEADLVIVDEASMLDTVLAHNLLKAVPPACQLLLVGDADQLPSVGPGNVLAEIMRSGGVHVVKLRTIFRQAQRSHIVVAAHAINEGHLPALDPDDPAADFFFVRREEPAEILETLKTLVAERIPKKFGLSPVGDIQVLTPMHRGILGAANLNAELQALLNPLGEQLVRGARLFRVGDKVMQIRNNYDLEVFNGDIGRIESLDDEERRLDVRLDGRTVRYDFADLDELVLAYACSIHKSQGSEYPCVVLPLHTQHYMMLQRNLLYTGVTRGKRLVVLVGSPRAVAIAVRNNRAPLRHTRLGTLLARPG